MKDTDGDGLFDTGHPTGGTPGSGLSFGIGGTPARFQYRDAGFSTEHTSGLAGISGHWYHHHLTIGASSGGNRSITLALRDLTAGTEFDFNPATPAIDNWTFTVTDAQFGTPPELSDGIFIRATSASRIDNILATVASPPFKVWIHGFPDLAESDRLPGADPDADGISNLLEFALAGDSTVPDPSILPVAGYAGNQFLFRFHRRSESASDTTLVLQHRTDFSDSTPWTDVAITAGDGSSGIVSWTVDGNGTDPDLITAAFPMSSANSRFVRLMASQLP